MVADEVPALAETSDKALRRSRLAGEIQVDVRGVVGAVKKAAETSAIEAKAAAVVVEALENRREDMRRIAKGSEAMLNAALEAERAVSEAQKGAGAGRERGGATISWRGRGAIGGSAAGQGA